MRDKISKFFDRIQRYMFIQAMQKGLISLIPLLMIGSFALLFATLPIDWYLAFITTWCDGLLYNLFIGVNNATMGVLSLYMAGVIGYHMGILSDSVAQEKKYGTMLVAVGAFMVLSGAINGENSVLGAKGMFLAIIAAGISGWLYILAAKRVKNKLILADGADMNLRSAVQTIFPALFSLGIIVLANNIILEITGAKSVYSLLLTWMGGLTGAIGKSVWGNLMYILISCVLWFLGVHGSDVLESVSDPIFQANIQQNIIAVQNGQPATEFFTRQFINSFVQIGGCGAALCLLIALLLFSKRRGIRNLTKLAATPMFFNINEIMVFGLPIIYNPVFLIPFVAVPVVLFFTTYIAMTTGLVPMATVDIQWTTPILFNGYLSTGSVRGILLQMVNVAIGVAIYAPFVRIYDKKKNESAKADYAILVEKLKASEVSRTPIRVTDSTLSFGSTGKALAADLEYAFAQGDLKLFYQPQYNDKDECIGVEALLRWQHPNFGWVYPPLIIKLAEETGIRDKLEKWVITSALADAHRLREKYPNLPLKISVNVTGASIQQKKFEDFLEDVASEHDIKALRICLEITEQDALLLDETLRERFCHLKDLGYILAVDDFSMGSTSIGYLTGSHFELVKLDGSLVKGIMDNPRCREIIASIVQLSDSLEVDVLAEYVSDAQIREKLLEVGCRQYQGWYYSPAIPLEEFEKLIEKEERK